MKISELYDELLDHGNNMIFFKGVVEELIPTLKIKSGYSVKFDKKHLVLKGLSSVYSPVNSFIAACKLQAVTEEKLDTDWQSVALFEDKKTYAGFIFRLVCSVGATGEALVAVYIEYV